MSEWLQPLPLQNAFGVALRESFTMKDHLPDWVEFLIWAGWWMNKRLPEKAKYVLVLLLPTRICCSAFCCLGALIRSIEKGDAILSWDQFMKLPVGNKVCLRYPDPKERRRKIPVEGMIWEDVSKVSRNIKIISQNRRFSGLFQSVFHSSFNDYAITSAPPPSSHLDKKVSKILLFYNSIMNNFNGASVLSWSKECVLVTSLAGWKSETDNITLYVHETSKKRSHYALQELLMPSYDPNAEYSGIFMATPKSNILNMVDSPLAILNGPDAVKSWDRIKSSNIIILLDHLEYDVSMENILALLSDACSNRVVDLPEGIPENLPSGVEMALFDLV